MLYSYISCYGSGKYVLRLHNIVYLFGFLCIGLDIHQNSDCGVYASPTHTQLLLYPRAAALSIIWRCIHMTSIEYIAPTETIDNPEGKQCVAQCQNRRKFWRTIFLRFCSVFAPVLSKRLEHVNNMISSILLTCSRRQANTDLKTRYTARLSCHLSGGFDTEKRTVFLRKKELARGTIDKVIRERYLEMNGSAGEGGGSAIFSFRLRSDQRRTKGKGQTQQGNVGSSVDDNQWWGDWSASDSSRGGGSSNRGSGGGRGRGGRGGQDWHGRGAGRGTPFGNTSRAYWPSAGQHQGHFWQPQGSQDPQPRCHRCDRIGHTKKRSVPPAKVIFEDDPNPCRGAYMTHAHGSAAQFSDPPPYNSSSATDPPPPSSIGPSASHAGSSSSTLTYSMYPYNQVPYRACSAHG